MDGRSGAAGTGGELRAGIEGSRGGGVVAYKDGRTGAQVQARLGRRTGAQTGKPTAQMEPNSILARNYHRQRSSAALLKEWKIRPPVKS